MSNMFLCIFFCFFSHQALRSHSRPCHYARKSIYSILSSFSSLLPMWFVFFFSFIFTLVNALLEHDFVHSYYCMYVHAQLLSYSQTQAEIWTPTCWPPWLDCYSCLMSKSATRILYNIISGYQDGRPAVIRLA